MCERWYGVRWERGDGLGGLVGGADTGRERRRFLERVRFPSSRSSCLVSRPVCSDRTGDAHTTSLETTFSGSIVNGYLCMMKDISDYAGTTSLRIFAKYNAATAKAQRAKSLSVQ